MHGLIFLMSIVTGQIKKKKKFGKNILLLSAYHYHYVWFRNIPSCRDSWKDEKMWVKNMRENYWEWCLVGRGGGRKLVGSGCFLSKPIKTLSPNKMRVKMRSKSSSAFWMKLPIDFEQIFIYFFLFSIFT